MRNYGQILQDIAAHAATLPSEQQTAITRQIVGAMAVRNRLWNADQECSPARLVGDLTHLSGGKLSITVEEVQQILAATPQVRHNGNNKKKR